MENSGFNISGEPLDVTDSAAIIVVGLSRGGTSVIAASLHALGMHIGDDFHQPNFEDVKLARAFRDRNWRQVKTIIQKYESEHDSFAWKLPDIHGQLSRVHKYCSNPRYIFVYRDIFAIAQRRALVHHVDMQTAMKDCVAGYTDILKFIKKSRPYSLHVSYEKLLQHKQEFAEILCKFCDVQADATNLEAVQNVIEPSPDAYIKWTKAVELRKRLKQEGYEGNLDIVNAQFLDGWAKKQADDSPIKVDIFVNQKLHGHAIANLHRQDLTEAGVSQLGHAGFHYEFSAEDIAQGDEVAVKIESTDLHIIGSPVFVHTQPS